MVTAVEDEGSHFFIQFPAVGVSSFPKLGQAEGGNIIDYCCSNCILGPSVRLSNSSLVYWSFEVAPLFIYYFYFFSFSHCIVNLYDLCS